MTIIILRHLISYFIIGGFPTYYTSSAAVYIRKPELTTPYFRYWEFIPSIIINHPYF